ncbi:MAG: hypothetical protein MUC88_00430 [Planctomycetes bacterium]|nr:hypothetical protein [Planctomycetota bacterium]
MIEVLQVGVDELHRRHVRLRELRQYPRAQGRDDEIRLLYDQTMPLLSRTGAKDLLALAWWSERVIAEYAAWFEQNSQPFEIRLERIG